MMCESSTAFVNGSTIKIKKPTKKAVKISHEPETILPVNTSNHSTDILKGIIENEIRSMSDSVTADPSKTEVLAHLGEYIEEPYTIIESYFGSQYLERLVRHQIESYNHFINFQIQRTIQMFNPVTIHSENDFIAEHNQYFLEVQLAFDNFKLYPPQIHENNGATKVMLPQEAKLRNFTYASTMTVDVHIQYIVRNTEAMDTPKIIKKTLPKINIGKMPIMIKSSICVLSQNKHIHSSLTGECSMDCGGYFVVKGSEKTVLGQERAAENKIYCFDGKNTTKWNWFAEIKSVPDFKCISPKQIEMMIASKNNGFGHGIYMTIPRIKQPIELFVVFRALGIITDKDICQYILLDIGDETYRELLACLQASIIDANKCMTQEDALRHITGLVAYTPINMDKETGMRKKREFTLDVLNNDLFPHCKTMQQKLYLVGYMANKLIKTSLGWLPPDDRDSYLNKRIELTGTLLNNLFRNYFNKLVKEMQKQIVREINTGSWRSTEDYENIINMTNIYKIMKSTTIENGITRALSTGDFSIKQSNSSKVGVAQVLNRLTYLASLSHLRRINTPLEKSGELIAPRKLHNTTWGYCCCLTGDSEVLLSNRVDTKQIKDMRDGDWVNTVHRENLRDESSPIHSFFSKMPDKLFEITTISGRKIKATSDHPFLINVGDGKYEMKEIGDLRVGDKTVIRHMVKMIRDEHTTRVVIDEKDVLEHYRMELLECNMLNNPIPHYKLKIIARLIGLQFFSNSIYLQREEDASQLANDISKLGFWNKVRFIKTNDEKYEVIVDYETLCYQYFINLVCGNIYELPQWLLTAERSIKREFLSAFLGKGLSHDFNNTFYTDKRVYMQHVAEMLNEFSIQCRVTYLPLTSNLITTVSIVLDNDSLEKYYDTIGFTYCEENRHKMVEQIELHKIRTFYRQDMTPPANWSVNGCVSVPILSIREIEPEPVYDFTTYSENHSFVADGFVVSNCSETPEGQSIGVVKNISYLAHITIPTNSSSLYEYVQPFIEPIETMSSMDMNRKVKVFVNGAWLGITQRPMELYHDMKDKKYRGIINIYTSVTFDFKLLEIRICNDGGRLTRPVLKVRNNKALITLDIIKKLETKELSWNDLLTSCRIDESVIEYIDPDEQNLAMIAMKSKDSYLKDPSIKINYTHCEIHPSTIFGVLASCIPFPEHNQSPRNTYQCIFGGEHVCSENNSVKQIKDVKVGDKILTFHPETLEMTETLVKGQFVQPSHNPVYELTTVSGRKIVATSDHTFMTDRGWKTVDDMILDSTIRLGISMKHSQARYLSNKSNTDILLTEEQFHMKLSDVNIVDSETKYKVAKWSEQLKQQGLLPLYHNNQLLPVLARIFGSLSTDASFSVINGKADCTFCMGRENDAIQLQNDMFCFGFPKNKISEIHRETEICGRFQTHHVFNVSYHGCAAAFLLALGAGFGRKTETPRRPIPEWIVNDRECSREFLRGFQGGDGCKIRWNKMSKRGENFVCAETSQQISYKYQDSLVHFMDQCVTMMRRFGIETSDVKIRKNKNADDRIIVAFKIADKHDNLIRYFDEIGYAYAETKFNSSFQIVEYLKAKKLFTERHVTMVSKVREIYDTHVAQGLIENGVYAPRMKEDLSKINIHLSLDNIRDMVRSYKAGRKISTPDLNKFTINTWLTESVTTKNGIIFVPIASITRVENQLVSCIETESENHSFITTHGILSKNCAMSKQAIGVYAMNYDQRMDKTSYILTYPSRSLVDTRVMNFIQLSKIPSGTQIHVAIMTHTGYNQEDSVLVNKGSIDRGLFSATIYHTEKDEDKNIVRDEIIRCKPDKTKTKGIKFGNYDKLDSQGFIPENTRVDNRDVIIAKIIPIKENRNDPTKTIKYEDQSKTFRTTEETYIDKNYTGRNGDGYNFAKVRVRTFRKPVLGDKFSSRHGKLKHTSYIIL
jgi:DNA-directed RNA polymerase beta subunit